MKVNYNLGKLHKKSKDISQIKRLANDIYKKDGKALKGCQSPSNKAFCDENSSNGKPIS